MKSSVSYPILTAQVRFEQDIVEVRQKARQIAAGLGFDSQAQTRIATAVSEIARNAFKYAGGKVGFIVEGESPQIFRTRISDKRISKVVQAPGFIRGINPKSKIENPQAPAFIRGVNLKSKI